MNRIFIFVCLVFLNISLGHAAVTIDVVESGGNVVATASGTINTSGLGAPGFASNSGLINGTTTFSSITVGPSAGSHVYSTNTGVRFTSINDRFLASANAGNFHVGISSQFSSHRLVVTRDYVSGTQISSTSTWNSTTMAGLGLIPGTYTVNWGSGNTADSLTLNIPGFSVGGEVFGLTGAGLELQNNGNGGEVLAVAADGRFTFTRLLASGSPYDVNILTQPFGQSCQVTNGLGTVSGADITDVVISCSKLPSVFKVNKAYTDDNQSAVDVFLNCFGATVEMPEIRTVTPGTATPWNLSDVTADATCFASELAPGQFPSSLSRSTSKVTAVSNAPPGYTEDNTNCTAFALPTFGTSTCTITNVQNPLTITVNKTYTETHPGGDPEVEITLNCPSATVTSTNPVMTVGGSASFNVEDFPSAGENCTATESLPAGYVQVSAVGCDALQAIPGGTAPSCTISNRPSETLFTIGGGFSDSNPVLTVTATPVCTDSDGGSTITYSPLNGAVGENSNLPVMVKYFHANATCMATGADLVGYTQAALPAGQDCQSNWAVSDATDNNCGLFNQQDPVTVLSSIDFSDNSSESATFEMACPGGGTVTTINATASIGTAAEFQLEDFPWDGTECSVTEPNPPATYQVSATTCENMAIVPTDTATECTITNAQDPVTVTVNKTYTEAHPEGDPEVEITLSCPSASITSANPVMTVAGSASFTVEDFPATGENCTATETLPAGYEQVSAVGCDALQVIPGGTAPSCTISNRPSEALFTIGGVFSDGNPVLTVTATPVCTDDDGGSTITYSPINGAVGENADLPVAVKYFHASATCMATEADPVGYTQAALPTGQDCQSNWVVSDATVNNCDLFNQQDPITVLAGIAFLDNSNNSATFEMTCPGGGTVTTINDTASNGIAAEFQVADFPWDGTVCSISEPNPTAPYQASATSCENLAIVPTDTATQCTVTNAIPLGATVGIATLDRYGLIILALLLMSIGFVGIVRLKPPSLLKSQHVRP